MMIMMMLVQRTFDVELLAEGPTRRSSVVLNLVVLLTYPTNFFIYCAMSTQFPTITNSEEQKKRSRMASFHPLTKGWRRRG